MIGLLQRVSGARVEVAGETVGEIGRGVLALVGVERDDTDTEAARLLQRLLELARAAHRPVASGRFGASMQVMLVNDGPVTFWLRTAPPPAR